MTAAYKAGFVEDNTRPYIIPAFEIVFPGNIIQVIVNTVVPVARVRYDRNTPEGF